MNIASFFSRKPSKQTLRVLAEFLSSPKEPLYGYELLRRTNLGTGSLYTILNRLNEQGLLTSHWRNVGLDGETGRPYRVYQLTEQGKDLAARELAGSFAKGELEKMHKRAKAATASVQATEGRASESDCAEEDSEKWVAS